MTRYLGPRTYWVAWFGAVVLTGAALVHFATLRAGGTARPSAAEIAGLALLLVPVVAVAAVPEPDLGALAAGRKSSGIGSLTSSLPKPPANPGDIGFSEIFYASESSEYATAVGIVDGTRVDLTGFVTHPKRGPAGTFSLTRFYVSCCAADAIPYSVAIDSGDNRPDDTWLRVKGTLRESDGDFMIEPASIVEVQSPKNPYLY